MASKGRVVLGSVVLVAAVVGAGAGHAGAQTAPGVPFSQAQFTGTATGTIIHADALEASGTRLADAEVSFTGAAVNSTASGLSGAIGNEMNRPVVPAQQAGVKAYARGSAIEAGLGLKPPSATNQAIVAGLVEARAPGTAADQNPPPKEVGPVPAGPLAYATAAKGTAAANWAGAGPNACPVGSDLARGTGLAADVQLVDTTGQQQTGPLAAPLVTTDAPSPDRAVVQSTSHVRLVPQIAKDNTTVLGGNFGVMSEVRMTMAPVTIAKGTPNATTIELLGEWVLRAVATGVGANGQGGYVWYGPGATSPQTPVLRIINDATGEVTKILNLQDITKPLHDNKVLPITIPELGAEIELGENPRNVTETPTHAGAAVDVARIRLLDHPKDQNGKPQDFKLLDLRVGHMEVDATAPAGGISCGLAVTKSSDKQSVTAGEGFTYTIGVTNTLTCKVTGVTITDDISATQGVTWTVGTPSNNGKVTNNNHVVWNVGDLNPGQSVSVTLPMTANADSAAGTITDTARASGVCAVGAANGQTSVDVPVGGSATINVPNVSAGPKVAGAEVTRPALPRTGGPLAGGLGLGLVGSAFAAARMRLHLRRRN